MINITSYKNNSQPNFKAKFFKTEALEKTVAYAKETGRLEELIRVKKSVESCYIKGRIEFDASYENGRNYVSFTKYMPKPKVYDPKNQDDYVKCGKSTFISNKDESIWEYALNRLLRFCYYAPNNYMFYELFAQK